MWCFYVFVVVCLCGVFMCPLFNFVIICRANILNMLRHRNNDVRETLGTLRKSVKLGPHCTLTPNNAKDLSLENF